MPLPYWPSSRVGAVPQGQPLKTQKRSERFNHNKGITMEDLKKQTAIRLAQEQQQRNNRASVGASFTGAGSDHHHHHCGGVVQTQGARSDSYPPVSGHGAGVLYVNDTSVVSTVPESNFLSNRSQGSIVIDHSPGEVPYVYAPTYPSPVSVTSTTRLIHPQDGGTITELLPIQSSSSLDSPSNHNSGSQPKSKLPHGLTVQELKEMTKARLQAEASDLRDNRSGSLDCNGPVSASSYGSSEYRERIVLPSSREVQSSPKLSVQKISNESNYPSLDNWPHDSRNDVWESGSVSTSTSDYNGSESASAFVGGGDCNRQRSFSTASSTGLSSFDNATQREAASPLPFPSMGYYDAPNRRRAATLSPRGGLSHLYEDRPLASGGATPTLPAFVPVQSRSTVSSAANSVLSDGSLFAHQLTVFGVLQESNRTRSSSTASLPPMSHTSEEFALGLRGSFLSDRDTHRQSVTGLSCVFRDAPSPALSAPPGFVPSGLEPPTSLSPSRVGLNGGSFECFDHDDRNSRLRAATWSESNATVSDGGCIFGPSLFSSPAAQPSNIDVHSDLVSILRLSGAEHPHAEDHPFLSLTARNQGSLL